MLQYYQIVSVLYVGCIIMLALKTCSKEVLASGYKYI